MRIKKRRNKDYTLLISYACSNGGAVCALYQRTACSKFTGQIRRNTEAHVREHLPPSPCRENVTICW